MTRADFGYIHCLDEDKDFEKIMRNGVWDYVCSLKDQSIVRHIGFSTHSPAMARRFLETGMMDICMFSLNPAYDYSKGELTFSYEADREILHGIVSLFPWVL